MAGLDSLTQSRRTQYEALIPEIERSVREAQNARGGFYSGAAVDAEARAKADLLAKLAAQDAAEQAQASESARDRSLTEKIRGEEIKAAKRNALVGLLGSGVGAGATLGGLAYLNRGSQVPASGVAGAPASIGGGGSPVPINTGEGTYFPTGSAVTPDAPASMWSTPKALGLGAAGGGIGYLAARGLGAKGLGADIGAGLGGLGGFAAYSRFGGGNPYLAGLSGLAGSLGGGLLGNLFR